MSLVHVAPIASVVAGAVGLIAVDRVDPLSAAGWTTGFLYLLASNLLLARGLRRSGLVHLGPGNAATVVRSTLVGIVTALVATAFTATVSVALLTTVAAVALALDAVDGWLARRTGSVTELGARFDMEVDAFLLLVLSVHVAPVVGWWAVVIGMLRYAFVAAGWLLPWMRATLPARYWRKVVTAVAGIALVAVTSGLLPWWAELVATLVALGLLAESFGRDVIWLAVRKRRTITGTGEHTRDEAG